MAVSGSILGNPVTRVEDPRILRGEATYFDDLSPDGTAHVAFVRSTIAHARVTGIDTTDAETMPGVLAVHTRETFPLAPVPGFVMLPPVFSCPPLADGVVRFVGDIVAVVLAETRAQAADAAELVIVDYEPLPVVLDPEAALADGATVLFPAKGSNEAIEFNFGTQHTLRVQQWYQRVLPEHRIVAHCRTYDVALELVRAGFGVCLVPALTALQVAGSLDGIELYATDHGDRRTVAIIADQYLRLSPYKNLIEALKAAGRSLVLPPILPMPKVMARAEAAVEA